MRSGNSTIHKLDLFVHYILPKNEIQKEPANRIRSREMLVTWRDGSNLSLLLGLVSLNTPVDRS